MQYNRDIKLNIIPIQCKKTNLVGGFNPFEKYSRQIGSFPKDRDEHKKIFELPPTRKKKMRFHCYNAFTVTTGSHALSGHNFAPLAPQPIWFRSGNTKIRRGRETTGRARKLEPEGFKRATNVQIQYTIYRYIYHGNPWNSLIFRIIPK